MTSTSGAFRTKYTHAPRFGNCESNRSTRSPKGVGTPPGTAKPTRCTSDAVPPHGTGKEVFLGEVRGGAGTYGLAAKAFPGVLCTPEGPGTGASGGGAGGFLGRGSEGVTHSSPP